MPAPASNDEFLALVDKSGVLDAARLKTYLKKLGETPDGVPKEPAKLATVLVRDGQLTHFQAEQLLLGKWKRFTIGKYKVLERLGVGGMGQVFLCEHKLMKRRVAVKVLPAAKATDEAALSRFYREARAVAAVDHPNLVRAYDIDQDENLHFIVMEFVDGSNLHDMVKRYGPMDVLRACHYMYGSAVGLQHAHEMGLVHRDIKPANILVDRSGVVKILDMGLARFFHPEEDDMLTKKFDENVLGTADFLAPEQAIDSSTVDIRADIYGLGGTFFYLLAGQPPFADGTVAQKLLWHQSKPPRPIREIRPDVPEQIEAILDKMLAKDAADRFQTPAELMDALAPWVQTPIPPPPTHEMPSYSAAASGMAGRTMTPGSGSPLATGSSRKAGANAAPTMAARPSAKAAATLPVPAVWESITNDTQTIAQAETPGAKRKTATPAKGSKSDQPPVPKAEPKAKRSLVPWIAAGIAGLFLVLAGGGVTLYYVFRKPKVDDTIAPVARTPVKWYVSAVGFGPDQSHTKKTVQEALTAARAGDSVVILDDRIESTAVSFGGKNKTGIRIEAGNPSKMVTWVYKPSGKTPPPTAFDLLNAEDTWIENIVFELGGQVDTGLRFHGQCGGVTVQNVTIRQPKKTALAVSANESFDGKKFQIDRLRVVPISKDQGYDQAVELTGSQIAGIEIRECRFEGAGRGSALKIDGACTGGIEFRNNRIYRYEQGILIAGVGDKSKPLELRIETNTFFGTKNAGIFAEAPITLPTRRVFAARNLFALCNEGFRAPGDCPGLSAEQNGDIDTKDNSNARLKLDTAIGLSRNNVNPETGDDFLRGPMGIRPTINEGKTPVGIE